MPEQAYIDGLLGVYELNRIDLLSDVFTWAYAYACSCARYSVVRQSQGEPDPFRLRHRSLIAKAVREAVTIGMDIKKAAVFIRQRAEEKIHLVPAN